MVIHFARKCQDLPRGGTVPSGSTVGTTTQQFGKYVLQRKLAEGGMAEVFLAKLTGMEGFEKLVVVKRILPQLCSDDSFVKMFLNEARASAPTASRSASCIATCRRRTCSSPTRGRSSSSTSASPRRRARWARRRRR